MKVEYSPEKQTNKKTTKRKKRRNIWKAFFLWLVVLVVGTISTLSLTVWFKINSFSVGKCDAYSNEQIINATGISLGDNLIRMSTAKAENRLEKNLPYIKKAEVKRKFPNTVTITVTPAKEYATVVVADTLIVIDSDYKVLKSVIEPVEELPLIKGLKTQEMTIGSQLEFTDEKQHEILKELIDLYNTYSLEVTAINVENLLDITFIIEDRMYVQLGSYSNMKEKIVHLNSMLPTIEKEASVRISLAPWSIDNKKTILVYEDISSYR